MKYPITLKLLIVLSLLLSVTETIAAPIFTPDSQPTGWLARPTTSSMNLTSGNEVFFQVDYSPDTWSGDILANNISSQALVQATGPWDGNNPTLTTAASLLDSRDYSTSRKIVTMNGSNKVTFRWGNLSASQQSSLGDSTIGPKILNYVRGDRSNEQPNGESFYAREHVMGDAKHSSPYYWEHDTSLKYLYAGTNDGMLHVFNADSGAEVFAYIPSMVIPNLEKLSHNPYVHTHFVDGPISIANVDYSGTVKTLLVGGLGAGGKGLYALDISSPTPVSEADAANKIKWEISATGSFADLGYTYGTPKIARLNNGTAVVIIGNGYVNSGNGHAILYVINLNTGALIQAIDTNSGSTASPNGLSTPSLVDTNGDGKVEYAYAGDIDGNLWKFNLSTNTSSLLHATSPAQAITVAPAIYSHPEGGMMVAFATGRILTTGDETDTSIHYAYGIWDGAPAANNQLLSQTLNLDTFNGGSIRTVTANPPDWTAGSGNHKGWKVALPSGERAVGEAPMYNSRRYYFLSTNPTVTNAAPPNGANWLNELDFFSGGSPTTPIFDLNLDGAYTASDLADSCFPNLMTYITCVPVSKYLGSGVFSQPILVNAYGFDTTLYAYHPDLPTYNGVVVEPPDPGVSGGHFDFDNYFFDGSDYIKEKHVHEYDDKYDVTGVNMLNASESDFNLDNAISSTSTQFKVLVMNQYLNPAATLSVGGATYESVKTYGNLASETNASTLLSGLPTYTRATIGTLIYNLPLDAFKSKDWWGDGAIVRAGLIPTKTGCVNKVNSDGSMENTGRNGLIGPNGERFNGALTIQLIKASTPSSALEFNHNNNGGLATSDRVKYGWRIKQSDFTNYVLAEFTSFWHHPNGYCYGEASWIADAPEDMDSRGISSTPPAGTADPRDGIFSGGTAISSNITTTSGNTATTIIIYSDGSTYTKAIVTNNDGSVTITQTYRDGTSDVTNLSGSSGTKASFIDPSKGSPKEKPSKGITGRQTWRELMGN